jgi:uncharacterized protein YjbI with pentapeptide repeats
MGEMKAVAKKERKRWAKNNPWYRLATLHGQPSDRDDEIAVKNRVTWNRWMARKLPADLKATLLEKGWTSEELTNFTDDELRAIKDKAGLPEDDDFKIDFSNTKFEVPLFASRFIFLLTDFGGSTFAAADFQSATFTDRANFESATFSDDANFPSATFAAGAHFDSANFTAGARFERATFAGGVSFGSATFAGGAHFERATFSGYVNFGSVTFAGPANFGSAIFAAGAHFDSATFTDRANFINAEMKDVTAFDDVTFARPPQCFNTRLHEGTTWHAVQWPRTPKNSAQAQEFVDVYERLKLEMDKLKKHGDELDFFALEQQCRRVVLGWHGLPIALYGFLSDYGRSYIRPLFLLGIVVVLGAVPLRAHFGGVWSLVTFFIDHDFTGAGLGLSFANTFSALGIRKELIDPGLLQAGAVQHA